MSGRGSTSRRRRSTSESPEVGRGPDVGTGTPEDRPPEDRARELVLRQLTAAARTRKQLADVLARHGIEESVADRVLDRFEDVQLVDDEAFAHAWVESRHRGRGLSRRALAHELRRRGVDEELVRGAVDDVSPAAELEAARTLVRARLHSTRRDDPVRRMRRLTGMLARKGYGPALAYRAVREEIEAADGTIDDVTDLDGPGDVTDLDGAGDLDPPEAWDSPE